MSLIKGIMLLSTIVPFVLISAHMQVEDPRAARSPRTRRGPWDHGVVSTAKQIYTFAAAIFRDKKFVSTGALISDSWVVTSASPFINLGLASTVLIRLGSVNKGHGGMLISAVSVRSHPNYTQYNPEYDVALVRLSQAVKFAPNVRNVSSATKKCPLKSYQVANWLPDDFVLGASGMISNGLLRLSRYSAASRRACRQSLSEFNITLTHNILCLSPIIGRFQCLRDAGAPVLGPSSHPAELWGVTSEWKSPNCTWRPSPILATRLTSKEIKQWMLDTMNNINSTENATKSSMTKKKV